jgi:hypothetical protein
MDRIQLTQNEEGREIHSAGDYEQILKNFPFLDKPTVLFAAHLTTVLLVTFPTTYFLQKV